MSKGLEALKYITEIGISYGCPEEAHQVAFKSETIEKELKALEIIKKFVNIDMLMFKGELEQEEYELLKEVLL